MLDEQASQNFLNEVFRLWIDPEIDRRFGDTGVPEGFVLREALIKMPKDQPPLVQFNNEIGWIGHTKVAADVEVEAGDPIYLHQIEHIADVNPPEVDGTRVAFVYLHWTGYDALYNIIFDFTPNHPDYDASESEFTLGKAIGNHLQYKLVEDAAVRAARQKALLSKIGLWTVTSLLPFPISKIIESIEAGELEAARTLLVDHVTPEFIEESLLNTWYDIDAFGIRRPALEEALKSHEIGLFHASIAILIGHIEGVIVDWLHDVLPPNEDVPFRLESRLKKFESTLRKTPYLRQAYQIAMDSTFEFLKEGAIFQKFQNWYDAIDPSFAGRHAIQHGKYVKNIYTKENSVKLFLLLDTICQFMMFYESYLKSSNNSSATKST